MTNSRSSLLYELNEMCGSGQSVTKLIIFHQIHVSAIVVFYDYSTSAVLRIQASSHVCLYHSNVVFTLDNAYQTVRASSPA